MKIQRQVVISLAILAILLLGEGIRLMTGITIPGTLIGMVLLFLALMTKFIRLDQIDHVTKFLLDHLAFLFVPAGVGLISSLDVIGSSWLPILVIVLVSTVAVIVLTGISGAVIGPAVCRLLRIRDEVAVGVSIGTASHAVGTSKAMELGETQGAMSGLSIGIAGLITVILVPLFVRFL